jgi:glycoprotein 6-alpha-L-fucosyltransferase
MYNLSTCDGLSDWRADEAKSLAELVQQRLLQLQNPSDCKSARKAICSLDKPCGLGCQLHHVLYCFIVAYYTNRTMILMPGNWQYNENGYTAYFKPLSDSCTSYDKSSKVNG